MSNQIDKAFVQQYNSNLIVLAQQMGSKLRGTVMEKAQNGKAQYFDRMGSVEALPIVGRASISEAVDTPMSRRKVNLQDFYVKDFVTKQDDIRMIIDPRSPFAANMVRGLNRKLDRIIIAAAVGNASSVDADDASTSVGVAHTVDEDFGTGSDSDMTVEKMIEAKRILMANEVDTSEGAVLVMDAAALAALLNVTQVTSADYNSVRALVRGELDTFMGFKIIQSELLTSSSEGFKQCLAYTKSAIGLMIGQEIQSSMDIIPERHHATQVYSSMCAGAVRLEEEKLVVVEAYRA